jgi:hypothetical protein
MVLLVGTPLVLCLVRCGGAEDATPDVSPPGLCPQGLGGGCSSAPVDDQLVAGSATAPIVEGGRETVTDGAGDGP